MQLKSQRFEVEHAEIFSVSLANFYVDCNNTESLLNRLLQMIQSLVVPASVNCKRAKKRVLLVDVKAKSDRSGL